MKTIVNLNPFNALYIYIYIYIYIISTAVDDEFVSFYLIYYERQ